MNKVNIDCCRCCNQAVSAAKLLIAWLFKYPPAAPAAGCYTMGNSATKEQRPSPGRLRSTDGQSYSSPAGSGPSSPSYPPSLERPPSHPVYNVRAGRGSRPDLSSLLHIRSGPPPDTTGLEGRRESKQEREARKLEKERIAREKERERSMREEHVDGGYLVTQGVYTGIEDYNKGVVRQLMVLLPLHWNAT